MNTSDFTICPTSQPTAAAASGAVRVDFGSTWTSMSRPRSCSRSWNLAAVGCNLAVPLAGIEIGRHRELLRRNRLLVAPVRERLAVTADVLVRATERKQHDPTRTAVDQLTANRRRHPDQLPHGQLAPLALEQQRQRALEHQVDLLLVLVPVDPPALSRLQDDLVHPERAHP